MDINTINLFFSATILLALIWFAWWLRGKFEKIENRLDKIQDVFDNAINDIKYVLLTIIDVNINTLKILEKMEEIQKDQKLLKQIMHDISKLENFTYTVNKIKSFNPLTKSEVERLKIYIKVCQEGKRLLEYDEAKEFDQIAQKIKKERSDDVEIGRASCRERV